MGDDHPWSTAVVTAVVSPVLGVLLAWMVHPTQKLVRTTVGLGEAHVVVGKLVPFGYSREGSWPTLDARPRA